MMLLALLATVPWTGILAMGATLLGLAMVVGILLAQARRGVVDELRAALSSSATENGLLTSRLDRMEKDLAVLQGEVHALTKENAMLRELLVTRNDLDEKLVRVIEDAFQKQTRRLVDVLREPHP